MRKISISLPAYLKEDIYYISSEITRLESMREAEGELSVEKRHLILLIATFTEQSLKKLRKDIISVEGTPEYIKKYFQNKDEKEPLYVKVDSGNSIFKNFGKKNSSFKLDFIIKKKQVLFFDEQENIEEFEKIINKNRNQAAHEVQPEFTLDYNKIRQFYDYVLLFLEHYYRQSEELFEIVHDNFLFNSIDSYKEYFNSSHLVKKYSEHIFTYRRIQYREDIKANFSEEEWMWIFYQYFLKSDKFNNNLLKNIETIPQELRDWVEKISDPESVWRGEQDGFSVRENICRKLSKVAEENKIYINFPIKIKGDKIYFGNKEVE
ncbi:hypothetical protein [Streptococcus sp. 27098_8_113]|uniref:hypothetical protein n=1 Tax=Streptococcus sp. 27098_8_113 TaxID=3003669 RepID=UPI00352E624E